MKIIKQINIFKLLIVVINLIILIFIKNMKIAKLLKDLDKL